jgi:hypothetical protein
MILRNVEILKFYAVCTNVWKPAKKSLGCCLKVSAMRIFTRIVPKRTSCLIFSASGTAGSLVCVRNPFITGGRGRDLLPARRDDPEKLGFMQEKAEIMAQRITVKAIFTIIK